MTLSKFNGLTVEASIQAPEIGAGTTQRYSITAGTSGERFSILGSFEIYDRNRITQGDQPWARCPQQRRLSPLGFNDTDKCFPLEEGGVTVNTIGTGFSSSWALRSIRPTSRRASKPSPPDYDLLLQPLASKCAIPANALPGFECVGGLLY